MTDRTSNERAVAAGLRRLARIYQREADGALAAHGVSAAQAMPVLGIARLGDGARQGVLADTLGLEGPSLVRILDQLCANGLVERRDDPNDRRAKTLHLTDEGRALAAAVEAQLEALRAGFLAQASDADLAATLRVLASFEVAIEARRRGPRGGES